MAKMKKLLAVVGALFFMTAANAAGVAKIGDKEYESLRAAVDEAEEGSTITLVADDKVSFTEEDLEIAITKPLTIDGAGKTLYGVNKNSGGKDHDIFISGSADVTIKNIKLTEFGGEPGVDYRTYPIWVGQGYTGTLTLQKVTVDKFDRTAFNLGGGTVVVDGCTITCAVSDDDVESFQSGIEALNANVTVKGKTAITGAGSTYEKWAAASIQLGNANVETSTGSITIEDGTFSGDCAVIVSDDAENEVTIKGGKFTGPLWQEAEGDGKIVVAEGSKAKFYLAVWANVTEPDSDAVSGTVKGAGVYEVGKKVTLKATAGKGSAFGAWYREGWDGSEVSKSASYSFELTDADLFSLDPVVFFATFASSEYDEGSLQIVDLDGEEFYADKWDGNIDYHVKSFSAPKVTVKGLPAGLKYNATTGYVEGTATKPGVYTVTVTATNASVKKPTEDSTAEFTLVVPNLTDEVIPVADSYRDMTPGVEYTIEIPEAEGCKVTGLPAGMKWTAKDIFAKTTLGFVYIAVKANSAYGAPTKPGSYTVYFTKTTSDKVKHTATSTFTVGPFPKLTIETSGDGTGKVTGAGEYAANKKVTLKATPDTKDAAATDKKPETKKSVFAGWRDGLELLSLSPSFAYDMPEEDKTLTAVFITAAEDAEYGVGVAIDGVDLEPVSEEQPESFATNVTCGVYVEWPVAVDALSLTTVKVAGLPAGLKFTAKDIVDSKTKEVTVPANTIYGTPTKASKWNASTGLYEPTTVKITATTAGKTVKNFTVALTVEDLAVAGTFDGGSEEAQAQATLTIAANGKISGKYLCGGTNWTISASSFAYYDDGVYKAKVTRSSGKVVFEDYIHVAEKEQIAVLYHLNNPEDPTDGVILAEFARTDWKNDPWKTIGKTFPKDASLTYGEVGEKSWTVTLKFKTTGAVEVKGEFVTGKDAKKNDIVYKASGSATLIPTSKVDEETGSFSGVVYVYLAPNAKKNFEGHCVEARVAWDGEEEKFSFIK